MSSTPVTVRPVQSKKDRKAFVDFVWQVYKDDPHWVPPLKDEVRGLITPGKNPWFEHARAQLWLAERDGQVVGRISAQVDDLVQEHMGKGIGNWGMFEALDAEAAAALIAAAEDGLREQGMTQALGPISLSIWDEPGLEIEGFDEDPTAMMGHHRPEYRGLDRGGRLQEGEGPPHLRGRHRPLGGPEDQPADRRGRAQRAHPHPNGRQVEVRRGSAGHPQPPERRLVGQLGLRPADRIGDCLRRARS